MKNKNMLLHLGAGLLLLVIALICIGWLYFLCLKCLYENVFSKRYHRVDEKCPSSQKYLAPKASGHSRERFYSLRKLHGGDNREIRATKIWNKDFVSSPRRDEQPQKVKHASQAHLDEEVLSAEMLERIKNTNGDKNKLRAHVMNDKALHANKMTMDHIRINFWDFVWGMLFIYSGTTLLAIYGSIVMCARRWLHKHSVISPISRIEGSIKLAGTGTTDAAKLCADICLETTVAIYYKDINKEHGNQIARFEINDLPMMILKPNEKVATFELAHQLVIFIDLDDRRLIRTAFKRCPDDTGTNISSIDALCLIYFFLITACHVKTHCFANWGVDESHTDPYIRRLSSITVLYNHMGYEFYQSAVKTFFDYGLMVDHRESIRAVFDKSADSGFPTHWNIRDLIPHSSFVRYITPARSSFMKNFEKHAHRFGGIEGEAWFVGSIIHSLDHRNLRDVIPDPLVFVGARPEFISMMEMDMYIWSCFAIDIPILGGKYLFPRKVKDSLDPFHKVYIYICVYMHILNIHMDMYKNSTCIVSI
jgi:hypothetical protein